MSGIGVAVSGGADSLAALVHFMDQGKTPVALHALLAPERRPDDDLSSALEVQCRRLEIEFHILDLRSEFEALVIESFARQYREGLTPNPCAACNRDIKLGLLAHRARTLGLDLLATGHYARIENGTLFRGFDRTKDQSYFLALVPAEHLAGARFPLGLTTKSRVRDELSARGLEPCAHRESLEVCFVPGDYRSFLESRGHFLPGPGPIVTVDGRELGRHLGLWRHTLGQRRGLGIAHPKPLYVIDKDVRNNSLIVGTEEELWASALTVGNLNLIVPPAKWPARILVQTRYRQGPTLGSFTLRADARLELKLFEPQHRPTPGQVAAFYDGDRLLGGGLILPAEIP
ncbi:MAG: tRNA 2-thiouridine(34) synthase MnmA [Deltaproteobacteria bacterium]|nr:tRNA 2-thiouridine(34) synthase MnmA [Deltaproteobacteria bacterium]